MQVQYSYKRWVADWEKAIEKPEEILLCVSIANISDYLFEDSRYKRGFGPIQQEFWNKLKDLMATSIEGGIIQSVDPTLVLRNLNENDFRSVRSFLNSIRLCYRSEKFLDELKKEILRIFFEGVPYEFDLTKILIRALLFNFSVEYLKDLPKRSLSAAYFQNKKNDIISLAMEDTCVLDNIHSFSQILIERIKSTSAELGNDSDILNKCLKKLFYESSYWQNDIRYLVRFSKTTIEKHGSKLDALIKQKNKTLTKEDLSKEINNDLLTNDIDHIIQEYARIVVINIVRKLLGDYQPGEEGTKFLEDKNYFAYFSSTLKKQIYNDELQRMATDFSRSMIDCGISAFIDVLSKIILSNFSFQNTTGAFKEFLVDYIYTENQSLDSTTTLHFIFSHFRFLQSLSDYMIKVAGNSLAQVLDQVIRVNLGSNAIGDLLNGMVNKLIEYLSDKYGYLALPVQIDKDDLTFSFNFLFNEFKITPSRWRIFFILGGLDLNGKFIGMTDQSSGNGITLYDGRQWYFGESHKMDIFTNIRTISGEYYKSEFDTYMTVQSNLGIVEYKRNCARAFIDIRSRDHLLASKEAFVILKKKLSNLIFAFSRDIQTEKFRPQIATRFESLTEDEKKTHYRETFPPPIEILTINSKRQELIERYEMLLASSTVHHKQFIQALIWFEDGFWSTNTHARFASYWIALEQLISSYTGNKKGEALAEYIPKLIITWRDTPQAFALNRYLNEIYSYIQGADQLKKNLESDSKLKDWKNDYIILENLEKLKQLGEGSALEQYIINLMTWLTVKEKDEITKSVKPLQERKKFEIATFYSIRNLIMHEGATYPALLEYLVGVLEKNLVDTLSALLVYSSKNDIEDVIHEVGRPFY